MTPVLLGGSPGSCAGFVVRACPSTSSRPAISPRGGHPDQFNEAVAYLGATVGSSRVGLGDSGWHDRAVPGNHDRWKGDLGFGTVWAFPHMILSPTAAFRSLFSHLPSDGVPLFSAAGLPPVRFIRVDTDADIHPLTPDRALARGAFESHLQKLNGELPAKAPGEVRVLLAHHCREYRGVRVEINEGSRAALDKFMVRHEVDVLLSGHTHDARVGLVTVSSPSGTREILYGRCGTSTQISPRDTLFRRRTGFAPLDGFTKHVERSVLLHELSTDGGVTTWTTRGYVFEKKDRNGFFESPRLQGQITIV